MWQQVLTRTWGRLLGQQPLFFGLSSIAVRSYTSPHAAAQRLARWCGFSSGRHLKHREQFFILKTLLDASEIKCHHFWEIVHANPVVSHRSLPGHGLLDHAVPLWVPSVSHAPDACCSGAGWKTGANPRPFVAVKRAFPWFLPPTPVRRFSLFPFAS